MDITEVINKVNDGKIPVGYKKEHGYIVPIDWKVINSDKIFKNISIKNTNNKIMDILASTQDKGVILRKYLNKNIIYNDANIDKYKKVKKGNFVISLRSFQGGIEYSMYDGIISPAYTILEKIKDINDIYYKIFFKSSDFVRRLNVAVYGIRDGKQISYSNFAEIYLPYPPLKEQENIAKILQCCNKIITLKEELLNEKEKYKKYVMRELISGKLIREKFGVCVQKLDFASICCNAQLNNKYENNENNKEYYPVIDQGEQFISGYSNDITKVIECPHDGYVLYGDHTRVVKYINFNFIISGDGVKLFKAKKNIYTLFLYYLFCNEYVPSLGYSRHLKILKKRYFYIPPLKEQQIIVNILTKVDNEIELLKKELDLYKEKFKALSQILLTGIVRTNNLSEK